MKSFLLMNFFYKFIINYIIYKLINYEFYYEKGFTEKITGKIIDFVDEIINIDYLINIYRIFLSYIFLLSIFIMIAY